MAIYKLLLPKMGESVAEATVIKWNKNPGDDVEADETVMEIATDKVDSDVPSPVSGKLKEQFFKVDDIVRVGSVIATIETAEAGEINPDKDTGVPSLNEADSIPINEASEHTPEPDTAAAREISTPPRELLINVPAEEKQEVFEEQHKIFSAQVPFIPRGQHENAVKADDQHENPVRFYSPLVKNIAAQEGIGNTELDSITGTGAEGRLTKDDLLAYIQSKLQPPVEDKVVEAPAPSPVIRSLPLRDEEEITHHTDKPLAAADRGFLPPQPAIANEDQAEKQSAKSQTIDTALPDGDKNNIDTDSVGVSEEPQPATKATAPQPGPVSEAASEVEDKNNDKEKEVPPAAKSLSAGDEIIEMDRMRRLIANHMVMSKQTAPHVTSFVEADVTNLVLWREKVKANFELREGQKITYMPLFIEAVVRAIKDMPMINVTVNGTQIIRKKDINISMATSLPSGNLIVPVIKKADELSLVGLTKAVNDLANRARGNKLKPDDIQDGTFTITNIGSFGNLMGTPIINQPQVAILAVGAIKKKVAVIEMPEGDMIGIRHMMYLSLSYDHRVVDGALGGSFVKRVADYLENWDSGRSL